MIRGFRNCQGCVAPAATNRQQAPGLPVGPLLLRRNRSVFVCHLMGYLLDSGNPKILCLLVARAREAVSRNSAGRSPGRRRARAHASDGVLRMPCRRAARDGPGTGNQRPFQRGRPVAEATTHGGYLSQVDSPFGSIDIVRHDHCTSANLSHPPDFSHRTESPSRTSAWLTSACPWGGGKQTLASEFWLGPGPRRAG